MSTLGKFRVQWMKLKWKNLLKWSMEFRLTFWGIYGITEEEEEERNEKFHGDEGWAWDEANGKVRGMEKYKYIFNNKQSCTSI